jgi:hypothetical protein
MLSDLSTPPVVIEQVACPGRSLAAEFFTGSAWSLPLPLTIRDGAQRVRLVAHYDTRPFADAPYYSYRAVRTGESGRGAELEMLHHKLYLQNPIPPIQHFEVSHGYNLPTANVTGPGNGWQMRFGVGLVIAHPEGQVAGHELGDAPTSLGGGYHIAGVTLQIAVGRRYPLGAGDTRVNAMPEAKLTASWARIRVDALEFTVPNVAFHLLGGIGVQRCQ